MQLMGITVVFWKIIRELEHVEGSNGLGCTIRPRLKLIWELEVQMIQGMKWETNVGKYRIGMNNKFTQFY